MLRAVHAREDAVDKLRACCAKVSAALGAGGPGSMLLPSDPLGRLFYRWAGWLAGAALPHGCTFRCQAFVFSLLWLFYRWAD